MCMRSINCAKIARYTIDNRKAMSHPQREQLMPFRRRSRSFGRWSLPFVKALQSYDIKSQKGLAVAQLEWDITLHGHARLRLHDRRAHYSNTYTVNSQKYAHPSPLFARYFEAKAERGCLLPPHLPCGSSQF